MLSNSIVQKIKTRQCYRIIPLTDKAYGIVHTGFFCYFGTNNKNVIVMLLSCYNLNPKYPFLICFNHISLCYDNNTALAWCIAA